MNPHLASAQSAEGDQQAQGQTDEIIVRGARLSVSRQIDRTTYRVKDDLQAATGSAADVLANLPSVSVDADGQVSLRGDSHVLILIDGKPSSQLAGASGADGLSQIRGADVERVEVITAPSAEFKSEGVAGVINLITRRAGREGTSGIVRASIGEKDRYIFDASGTSHRGALTVTGGLNLRQDDRLRTIRQNRVTFAPDGPVANSFSHRLDEEVRRVTPTGKFALVYALGAGRELGVETRYGERSGDRHFLQTDRTNDNAGALTSAANRESFGHEWRLDAEQGLHVNWTTNVPGETLKASSQRTETREREVYRYVNTPLSPPTATSQDGLRLSLDLVTTEFALDYARSLGGGSLKSGLDIERDTNAYDNFGAFIDASGVLSDNPLITNHFRYKQAIDAAYVTYERELGRYEVLAGVRDEHTRVQAHQITGDITNQRSYERLYPSVHVRRTLSPQSSLTVSYTQRVSRPDPELLNPFVDRQDTQNLRAGNPDLRPLETRSVDVGYAHDDHALNYQIGAYYRVNRNSIADVVQVLASQVTLSTKTNVPRTNSGGVEASVNAPIAGHVSAKFSGNLYYEELDAAVLGGSGRSGISGAAKLIFDIKPTSDDVIQFSTNYIGRRLTPQGRVEPFATVNFGYRHKLAERTTVVLTVSDLFDTQALERVTDGSGFRDDIERRIGGRIFYFALIHSFGGRARTRDNGFTYDQ